jgi:hypothetical protein
MLMITMHAVRGYGVYGRPQARKQYRREEREEGRMVAEADNLQRPERRTPKGNGVVVALRATRARPTGTRLQSRG